MRVLPDGVGADPADPSGRVQPGAAHLLAGAAPILAPEGGGGGAAQAAAATAGKLAILHRGGRQAEVGQWVGGSVVTRRDF